MSLEEVVLAIGIIALWSKCPTGVMVLFVQVGIVIRGVHVLG